MTIYSSSPLISEQYTAIREERAASDAQYRILIIEDDPHMAFGLTLNLEVEGYTVLAEAEGHGALALRTTFRPHVVILDLMLPDVSGFDVLTQWRHYDKDTRIIVLSALTSEADRVLGLKLGADDYVTKPFSLMELIERVRRQLIRAAPEPNTPVSITIGGSVVDFGARTITRDGSVTRLSPKEHDLLRALVEAKGVVVSTDELLKGVWGHKRRIRTNTVQYHIAALRKKIEANPQRPVHILTLNKLGYRLVT
jgi:two-component system alkaline phosphatase synthesis response regulator PhoP